MYHSFPCYPSFPTILWATGTGVAQEIRSRILVFRNIKMMTKDFWKRQKPPSARPYGFWCTCVLRLMKVFLILFL